MWLYKSSRQGKDIWPPPCAFQLHNFSSIIFICVCVYISVADWTQTSCMPFNWTTSLSAALSGYELALDQNLAMHSTPLYYPWKKVCCACMEIRSCYFSAGLSLPIQLIIFHSITIWCGVWYLVQTVWSNFICLKFSLLFLYFHLELFFEICMHAELNYVQKNNTYQFLWS